MTPLLTTSATLTAAGPLTTGAPDANAPLREKARQLEGLFLNTLMSQMFSGIDTKGMFSGGFAEQTWRGIQAEQMASEVATAGGIGLADNIMKQLLSVQEIQQSAFADSNGASAQ
ncbi:MAG TPA: rod-binding protein [Devosiaceae bacterium]